MITNKIETVIQETIESENSDFVANGYRILTFLQQAYTNPEQYRVLSSSHELNPQGKILSSLPKQGTNLEEILEEAMAIILEGYCNVSHPQYYGYISPKPIPSSILGDLLASGLNQTPGAWRAGPSATFIEAETLQWVSQFIGYEFPINKVPNGIFTSGGTMANASALKLARDTILGRNIQDEGLDISRDKPTVYLSQEGHFSIKKALDFLGLGKNSLRLIPISKNGQIDLNILEEQIQRDVKLGYKPICLVGTAGTTATGAIDPLAELANLAKRFNMWFHVDAAAGGVFANLGETKHHFQGLIEADSVTLDPCKWLFVSFGIGCLLTKDGSQLVKSFQTTSHYWEELSEPDFFQMGLPGTRQWRSLGLWMAFKQLGSQGYYDLLRHSLATVTYLAKKVSNCQSLELLQETILPVCCFRICQNRQGLSFSSLNHLVQRKIAEKGQHYLTLLEWKGETYLRVSINNFTTNSSHIDNLIETILEHLD